MDEYTLRSPFLTMTLEGRPPKWVAIVFFGVTIVIAAIAVYAFAFILPNWIGFKTTVLVGIALLLLRSAAEDN